LAKGDGAEGVRNVRTEHRTEKGEIKENKSGAKKTVGSLIARPSSFPAFSTFISIFYAAVFLLCEVSRRN
jgi:hypothetical protein